jgi:diguanylate cyclase (GGDEF)-like protein
MKHSRLNSALLRSHSKHPWNWRVHLQAMKDPESYSLSGNMMALLGFVLALLVWLNLCFFSLEFQGEQWSWKWLEAIPWFFWPLTIVWFVGMVGLVGAWAKFWGREFRSLDAEVESLRSNSEIDILSGLRNRRGFQAILDAHLQSFRRGAIEELALLFLDIDHFKQINDQYGHACGDTAIQGIARYLEGAHRAYDAACRWGGEEFAVLAPGINLEQAQRFAERLRSGIENTHFEHDGIPLQIRVSIGVTCLRSDDDMASLLERADELLYQAKGKGRNRVEWSA